MKTALVKAVKAEMPKYPNLFVDEAFKANPQTDIQVRDSLHLTPKAQEQMFALMESAIRRNR